VQRVRAELRRGDLELSAERTAEVAGVTEAP
jgi:hypothetical protein